MALAAYAASSIAGADPLKTAIQAVKLGFVSLLVPFFFIYIGLQLEIESFNTSLYLVMVLLTVAVLGKVIGTGLPAVLTTDKGSA